MADAGPDKHDNDGSTVLGFPRGERLLLLIGLPVGVAVLLGFVLPPLARWLLDHRIPLPLGAVVRLLGAIDQPWEIAVAFAVGVAIGLVLAAISMTESMRVTLTDRQIRFDKGDWRHIVDRADVEAVFVDGKHLVVLDADSRQLVRDTHQASRVALAVAFQARGYPWREADPYAKLFRRWTPDEVDLPPAVNAVLAARQAALKKSDRQRHDLSGAVEKLGYAVREEGARQYWRPLVRS